MNKLFLKKSFKFEEEADGSIAGNIKGIAYSGALIDSHGPFSNLIVDIATLTVAKDKTPILRDHDMSQVAGHGKISVDGSSVTIDGKISKRSAYGQEILELSMDGFEWEMSLGVFGGTFEEVEDEEINGMLVDKGVALRNGILREVSIVALGADSDTSAEIFSLTSKKETKMFTKEQWVKFACGCGGTEKTTPEDLSAEFTMKDDKISEKETEIADLKKELQDAQDELAKIKESSDMSARESDLSTAIKAKGIEMSVEKIKAAAKSKDATSTLLSFIEDMKIEVATPKVSVEMSKKVDISDSTLVVKDESQLRMKAEKYAKENNVSFLEALNILEVK